MPQIVETAADKPMRLLSEAMRPAKEPSPQDAEILAAVHALAAEFAGLPTEQRRPFLGEVRKLTTGFDRFRATVFTPPDHPFFRPLMAMLDGLIATDERVIATDHGLFERAELVAAAASISPTAVTFPVAIRGGQAVYPVDGAGPTITPFRVVRPDEAKRPASMWGEEEDA